MKAVVFGRNIGSILFVVGALLIGCSWWFLQLSACAGDLKQATGDIEGALAFERQAFIASALGMLVLTIGIAIRPNTFPVWLRTVLCLLSFPIACAFFLVLVFFGGHASWVCAL
jgi:hypothetical protein